MKLYDQHNREIEIAKQPKRNYAAAQSNRLLSAWIAQANSPDSILKNGTLKVIRDRARELVRNDDFAKRYIQLLQSNVVGSNGIGLEMDIRDINGRPDEQANDIIESAWKRFSEAPTTDRQLTMIDLQNLVMSAVPTDGEMFLHIARNFQNGSLFAVMPHESDLLADDYNMDFFDGRKIVMSIEKSEWGEPLNYHIYTSHPGDSAPRHRRVIPASDIIHIYRSIRPGDTRGVSWMTSAMVGLHHIREYFKSEAVAARVAAAKSGFFVQDKDSSQQYAGDGTDDYGNVIEDISPGSFTQLPPGMKVETYDPKNPNSNFESFTKTNLRSIAAGLGVSYNSLASDLESVNYSSLRAGALEEREFYKSVQKWMVDHFMKPLFRQWLTHQLKTNNLGLPYEKFNKFNQPRFITRRWAWVDPQKDVQASILAINNLLRTRGSVIAENYGDNFYDTVVKASEEQAMIESLNLHVGNTEAGTKREIKSVESKPE